MQVQGSSLEIAYLQFEFAFLSLSSYLVLSLLSFFHVLSFPVFLCRYVRAEYTRDTEIMHTLIG